MAADVRIVSVLCGMMALVKDKEAGILQGVLGMIENVFENSSRKNKDFVVVEFLLPAILEAKRHNSQAICINETLDLSCFLL